MEHVSRKVLVGLLDSGDTCGLDHHELALHVAGCSRCWRLALDVLGDLESRAKRPAGTTEAVRYLLFLLRAQRAHSLARLGTQGRLAKLKRLTPAKRLDLIRTTAVYRTVAMVDVLICEVAELARSGSDEAEELGRFTLALIELLDPEICSDRFKCDLRGEAWAEMANGRRVRTDWKAMQQALKQAWDSLQTGTGSLLPVARLHSIRSSLAFDTGQTALAVKEAAIAQGIYRELEDWNGLAKTILKEATALVEIDPTRALALSEEGLRVTDDSEIRLVIYLKGTATQCLVELGRTGEALRHLDECLGHLKQFEGDAGLRLRFRAIEARLLEILERYQEAELLYRDVIEGAFAEGFAKECFTWRLMLFNFYVQRDRLAEAAALCTESDQALVALEAHQQMREVWRELSAFVEARLVDEKLLRALRLYLTHHWKVPAKKSPFNDGWAELAAAAPAIEVVAVLEPQQEPAFRPVPKPLVAQLLPEPPELVEGGLKETVDEFERRLIADALGQSGGRIRETARVLRTSRNTLKAKMTRYGLRGEE